MVSFFVTSFVDPLQHTFQNTTQFGGQNFCSFVLPSKLSQRHFVFELGVFWMLCLFTDLPVFGLHAEPPEFVPFFLHLPKQQLSIIMVRKLLKEKNKIYTGD